MPDIVDVLEAWEAKASASAGYLLQRAVDRGEFGIEMTTEAVVWRVPVKAARIKPGGRSAGRSPHWMKVKNPTSEQGKHQLR